MTLNNHNATSTAEIRAYEAKNLRTRNRAFCSTCQKSVQLMRVLEVTEFLRTTHAGVFELAEKQKLHVLHNSKGIVMICSDSLFRHFENCDTQLLGAAFVMPGKL